MYTIAIESKGFKELKDGPEKRSKFAKRNLFRCVCTYVYTRYTLAGTAASCLEFYATTIRYSGFSFAKLHANWRQSLQAFPLAGTWRNQRAAICSALSFFLFRGLKRI